MIKASEIDLWRRAWEEKEERSRIADMKELWRIYSHDWRELLERRLRLLFSEQTWEALRLQVDTSINLLRWTSDEQASIYSRGPSRSIEGIDLEDEAEDPLKPYLAKGALDLSLDQAARICYACRAVVLRPLVAGTEEGKPRIVVDVILPHRVFVKHDPIDLTAIQMIVVQKEDGSRVAWDKEEQVVVSRSWQVEDRQPNPYGVVPYVVAHASYPTAQYWSTSEAFGLRDATYEVGVAKTEHNHLRHFQSHRQGWYRSDGDIPLSVLTDPASWIHVRGTGDVGAIDLRADLKGNLESILDSAAATLALYGIRPESVKGSLDASSGYALALKLLAQEGVWAKQRLLWNVWEGQKLYPLARTVLQVDAGVVLPDGDLKIDWAEIGAQATPIDKAQWHKELLEMGVVSPRWVQRQMGLSPAEIEQIETEQMEAGVGRMVPPAAPAPAPMPEPMPPDPKIEKMGMEGEM